MRATVIGGGLAGSEAAWQLANNGVEVALWEMRPKVTTPAHHTGGLAELVCSNSLGSDIGQTAPALLKAEMRCCGSLILEGASAARVPAGGSLAVDRDVFSAYVSQKLESHPKIRLIRDEAIALRGPVVVATGPLTSLALAEQLGHVLGVERLHFFDAASPILTLESLDRAKLFEASRYGKGDGCYLNAPMNEEMYERFHAALVCAENSVLHLPDDKKMPLFEGCLPVEVIARRGKDALRFGAMKPVGLRDPRTGKRPFAVVQLRQDNVAGDLFNLVGFQTQLKWGEQKRVFSLIPGLENAEFVRFGVMHKNTYLATPTFLAPTLACRERPDWFFAGTLIGVEGYTEAAATGMVAGLNLSRTLRGMAPLEFPPTTMIGALCRYVSACDPDRFQPMNSNWGLIDPLALPVREKQRRRALMAGRALRDFEATIGRLPAKA